MSESNRDKAGKFITAYLTKLKIEDKKEIRVVSKKGERYYLSPNPCTLSEYLTDRVETENFRSMIVGTLFSATLKPVALIVSSLATAGIEALKRAGESSFWKELLIDVGLGFSVDLVEGILKTGLRVGETVLGGVQGVVEFMISNMIDFDDHKILEFLREEIKTYNNDVAAYVRANPNDENALRSSQYADKVYQQANGTFIEQQEDWLETELKVFVKDYVTRSDVIHDIVTIFSKLAADRVRDAASEYDNWNKESYASFYEQNPGRLNETGNHAVNGIEHGLMDSYRQVFSSARWILEWGAGEGARHFFSDTKLSLQEWVDWAPAQTRMDIWNSEIGRIIGESVLAELDEEVKKGKFELYSEKYFEEANARIAKLTQAAIETGAMARSVWDPRLQLLEDGLKNGKFDVFAMQSNAAKIFDFAQGGLLKESGDRIIDLLKKHNSNGTSAQEIDWDEILNSAIQNGGTKYRDIEKNNIANPGRYASKGEAHELLQIMQWVEKKNGIPSGACDPANDPFDDETDLDKEVQRFVYQRPFSLHYSEAGVIFASLYRDNENGHYYLAFEELKNDAAARFQEINDTQNVEDFANCFLNPAYDVYREVMELYAKDPGNLTLLGYGDGGAIASTLSAALYMGAFGSPLAGDKRGEYDAALAFYGWSLNGNGEIIDNYPAETVNAVTFNTQAMGWFFQKPELIEEDLAQNSIYTYRFDYPEENVEYMDPKNLRGAPVTNYGMVEDREFITNRWPFAIGHEEYLFATSGKIPKSVEMFGPISNWHALDTIELALHAPGEEEEEEDKEDEGEGNTSPPPDNPNRRPRDPLIIDLNRDGKVSTTAGKRYFDLDANGLIEQVSWAAPGDGLLVLDRNGDGKITSGRELFGDQTLLADGTKATAGFQALAEFDSNGDGIIDARDEVFSQLRIWADIDGDGVFGENEFLTLEEAGIESIGLDFVTERTTDENGNQIVRTGSVTWKDGDTSDISEFLLTNNMTKTVEYDKLDETDEIAKLPDLRGRGYLYSLHQAMLRDESGELASLVGNFADETNPADRRALLNKIMMRWGAVSDSTIPNDGILGFLDKYYGRETEDPETIADEGWRQLERNYEAISVYLYGQLLAQTHFADIFDNLAFDWDESRNAPSLYISDALEEIAKGYIDNPELAKQTVSEFFLVLKTIALYKYVSEDELAVCAQMLATYSSELADVYNASYIAMQYNVGQFSLPTFGTDASESMDGRMFNEILAGLDGNDLLRGGAGTDILIGGKGDDMLDGGADSDIYIWNLGDGNDTIVNRAQSGEIDILRLGEGIHAENARITRVGSTILLTIGESGERIALSTGDSSDHNLQVAQVEFADGTVWSRVYMYSQKLEIEGTDGADAIDGSTGDDTITGGKGDDVLRGDSGSDTYVWNLGDGNDMIVDYRRGADENVLKIGEGVDPSAVQLIRSGDSLVLAIGETGERITLPDWYGQSNRDLYRLTRVEFADGTIWQSDDMNATSSETGTTTGTGGDDAVDGLGGDDVITGGKGDDILRGDMGSDVYVWNPGDGNDTIIDPVYGADRNVLAFGTGVSPENILLRRNGEDLIITVGETGETITVSKWLNPQNHKLSRIEFANGRIWNTGEIDGKIGAEVVGTDGDDLLLGLGADDVMIGGRGDDLLRGARGNDIYVWNLGDGHDTIEDDRYAFDDWGRPLPSNTSTLRFGEGISPDDIRVRSVDDSLVVYIDKSGESITISRWYLKDGYRFNSFEFADGTVWTSAMIESNRDRTIAGTDAAETLDGYKSDDILVGGKGNDILRGGRGDDVYVWNPGDGKDTIVDGFGANTIRFGAGVSPGDVRVTGNDADLVLQIKDTGESVTFLNWYTAGNPALSKVVFDDGTEWEPEALLEMIDKTIVGIGEEDEIIDGFDWDDIIDGGEGNDVIRSGKGDDTLYGGLGNDKLYGGAGNDIYVWNPGDGHDTIADSEGINELRFGAGVNPEDLRLTCSGTDLLISIGDSEGSIRMVDWYKFEKYGYNKQYPNQQFSIVFDGGEIWGPQAVLERLETEIAGTDESETVTGLDRDDTIVGRKGDDRLNGELGSDTYVWNLGDGNDTIYDIAEEDKRNVLTFGEGVNSENIGLSRTGKDLIVTIGESGEEITIRDWFPRRENAIVSLEFADGTVWETEEVVARVSRLFTGSDEADSLSGYETDDTIIGGKGDDSLHGNGGDDTYIWNLGDGNDRIVSGSFGKGTLKFGEGVDPAFMKARFNNGNLYLTVGETGECITLIGWSENDRDMLSKIEFADGTIWRSSDLDANMILGGDDADYLEGTGRDETIVGGRGDDFLSGEAGSDTYIWNLGDGNDTIDDRRWQYDINVLKFGEGIDPSNMLIQRYNNDLSFTVGESGETIVVRDWAVNDFNMLSRIEFADGTVWRPEDINTAVITGTDQNDSLYGTFRHETIIGGKGDDHLEGKNGDDLYVWNPGDGNDYIYDDNGANVLEIGEGVDPSGVTIARYGSDIGFRIAETGEEIRVGGWFALGRNQLYEVRFADGTVWTKKDVAAIDGSIVGTDDDDELSGDGADDVIFGLDGNDRLIGGGGDDALTGGAGDDRLEGGSGYDTYIWNLGDGNDTIRDENGGRVTFGEGVEPSDIRLAREGEDLILLCEKTGERIRVEGSFDRYAQPASGHLSEVVFADGTKWSRNDLIEKNKLVIGTDGDDMLRADYSRKRDLTFAGGKGDDKILGLSDCNDTFVWNLGDGNDVISVSRSEGDTDILQFGEGVNPDEIHVTRTGVSGADLAFVIEKTGERITIQSWYVERYDSRKLSAVRFADGTVWTREEISAMRPTYKGTDGDDTLDAFDSDDVLIGGAGRDKLQGGAGNDTYIWNLGDGNDTIADSGNDGRLHFGEGIDAALMNVSVDGNGLHLTVGETGERITLKSYLTEIQFADGTTWSWEDVLAIVGTPMAMGTGADETLEGTMLDDILMGNGGDDVLRGQEGDDTYGWDLGDGNDTIMDAAGANVLKFGAGVKPEDISIHAEGSSLVFFVASTGEKIAVEGWTRNAANRLSEVRFEDGTIWTTADVHDMAAPILLEGTGEGELLEGTDLKDIIVGQAGDDYMSGGDMDDVYIWNLGDGNDTIDDVQGHNVLKLGAGISPENLRVEIHWNDTRPRPVGGFRLMAIATGLYATGGVTLVVGETGERITIADFYEKLANRSFEIQFEDGTTWTAEEIKAALQPWVDGDESTSIYGSALDEVIDGGKGDDSISAGGGDDTLMGGDGVDYLRGGDGNDTLIGGADKDNLDGSAGDDIFIWNRGDGDDAIFDSEGANVLQFGEGVSPADIRLARLGDDMQFIVGDDEIVTVQSWFYDYGSWGYETEYSNKLHEVRFADGTVWSQERIAGMELGTGIVKGTPGDDDLGGSWGDEIMIGAAGNDYLYAGDGDDHLYGGEGNDYLYGGEGDDRLEGGAGDDELYGDGGNDIMIGGQGSDRLTGGDGDDVYVWNLGDGNDTIIDRLDYKTMRDSEGANVLAFGDGIAAEGVSAYRYENSLLLIVEESLESITIENWFTDDESKRFGEIRFQGGEAWTYEMVAEMTTEVRSATEGDDLILGTPAEDVLHGGGGNDIIRSFDGDDTIWGDAGHDRLEGGEGNDTYVWRNGDGNDVIEDRAGENKLRIDGVSPGYVKILGDEKDLFLYIGDQRITVKDWLVDPACQLKEIRFGDDAIWSREYINSMLNLVEGTSEGEILHGYDGRDDVLDGHGGDDILMGGWGNDTYLWNVGDGNDRIIDRYDANVLQFGQNVTPGDVSIERDENCLYFRIGEERIAVENWFASSWEKPLQEVRFEDGTVWGWEHLEESVLRIEGTDAAETLQGYDSSSDVIVGGKGDDILRGGYGSDRYVWNIGDGNDRIEDTTYSVLQLGEGITKDSPVFTRDENHLYIAIGDETITIDGYFDAQHQGMHIEFADRSGMTSEEIDAIVCRIEGTEESESLFGYNNSDDTLNGRAGDDLLYGGGGRDAYLWNVGDGNDTISDLQGGNSLHFGVDVDPESIKLSRDALNLYIEIGEEKITIDSWYLLQNGFHPIEAFYFANGGAWFGDDINRKASYVEGTDESEELFGFDDADTLTGKQGNDILRGGGGGDLYVWNIGDGDDTIIDSQGANELRFGEEIYSSFVTVERDRDHAYFRFGEERIKVENWFADPGRCQLTKVTFFDDTVWTREEINQRLRYVSGTNDDDVLTGYDDTDDTLIGLDGDDLLRGLAGNDVLDGGKGKDILTGGSGNDTYVWRVGDGDDRIVEGEGQDTLQIGGGVTSLHVEVERDGWDLVFVVGSERERITIENWFSGQNQIETVRFDDGTAWTVDDIYAACGVIAGTTLGDTMRGTAANDTLFGFDRDDRIQGGAGDDVLIGGLGNDKLYGEAGDDVYYWSIGDGNDTILDSQGKNVLQLGPGISQDDIEITRDSDYLYIRHKTTGGGVRIESWYTGRSNQLAEVRFDDGSSWTAAELNAKFPSITGTEGNDSLLGYNSDDTIDGKAGNDIISGLGGNDTLTGGLGDDRLYGGAGNDVYIWSPGDGNDRIRDNEGNNTLRFGEGVSKDAVSVSRDANHLYLRAGDDGETICVEDWFKENANQLVSVEFSDGTTWSRDDINGLLATTGATDGDDVLHGTAEGDVLDGLAGNDTIYGDDGDDLLVGGKGRDVLHGEAGDDTYVWNLGDGNDIVVDNQGSNKLKLGAGINPTMVKIAPYGFDLALSIGEEGEYLRIRDWFKDEANRLSEIEFADGTVWTPEDINAQISIVTGTDGVDNLYGNGSADLILGSGGNDRLYGQGGNDSLVGGLGNDYLDGGAGNDSYIWNPGDGNDTVSDYSGINVLQFGQGVDPSKTEIQRSGNNLVILTETGEYLTVANWYASDAWQLSEIRFEDGIVWSREDVNRMRPVFRGTDGNDTLNASSNADLILGNAGNDKIYGYAGNDEIVGGHGDDYLDGGVGDDLYIWNHGEGNDIISDNSGINTLKIGEGIDPAKIEIERSGDKSQNMVLVIAETGERITVANWYDGNNNQLAKIEFADGTAWTRHDVNAMSSVGRGTEGDDVLYGTYINDTLLGYAGNDKLFGYAGNDTLNGGTGDDYLDGGAGNDTYIWNPGDGNDTIIESGGANILEIGEGVDPSKMEIRRNGNDIILAMTETGEQITVLNWYAGDKYQLSEIRFADGTVMTNADVNRTLPVFRGTETEDTVFGSAGGDLLLGLAGDDKLFGYGGDDVLTGGTGADHLEGGEGDDTYVWNLGDGNDTIRDQQGANLLKIGEGVDPSNVTISLGGTSGKDLLITVGESGEQIVIANWRSSKSAQLAGIDFGDGVTWSNAEINALLPPFDDRDLDDVVNGMAGDETLNGYGGDDTLRGNGGNDTLDGGDGNDALYGGDGNDTLIGGAGDDYLEGGKGVDTYVWNLGDGNDSIYDDSYYGTTYLKIGEGVSKEDLEVTRSGQDLILVVAETGERLTIKRWYDHVDYQLNEIQFADGSVMTRADINAKPIMLHGTDGDDTITGYGTNDALYGGDGNDTIRSGDGHDTLVGGTGDDYLEGGKGVDTYVWNLGDGNDTIYDDSYYGTTYLKMGEGVSKDNLSVTRSGQDLILVVGESGERLTIKRWYDHVDYQLNEIQFADGGVVTRADIDAKPISLHGTDVDDVITGYSTNDVISGGTGNDTIRSGDGHDTLIGGTGDDYLEGGKGVDTYVWNLGDGNDTIYDDNYYGVSHLKLGEGVSADNIEITRSGNNMVMIVGESGERITVTNWYASDYYQLNKIEFADGTILTNADINAKMVMLRGADGDDTITGYSTSEHLLGGAGNDKLYGGDGHDTLIGGAGDDYMEGGKGADAYVWNLGDGNDTIYDDSYYGTTCLKIGEGVSKDDLEVTRSGQDLILVVGESGERLTIKRWYDHVDYQLNEIQFADGGVMTREDINAKPVMLYGTDSDDVINGYGTNDVISGGTGNDTIRSGEGHDTLIGGAGDDYLEGGKGVDTYVWNLGDGRDTIYDDSYYGATYLKIGEGVSGANMSVVRNGSDLQFIVGESNEQITIKRWYDHVDYQLNEIRFSDGTVWTRQDMNQIAAGTMQPFSTAPVVESQPEEGGMGPLSVPMSGNGENTPMFSILGDPAEGVQTSYRYGEEIESLSSLAATPTDWASDPSLASIMNEPALVTAADFAASQLDVDIAVASLQFGSETPEQVCDLVGSAASASGVYTVSTSAESGIESHFSEERRKSA